jgi:tRNA threonylcarbamoyladenosine biosynthesis protein TsaB
LRFMNNHLVMGIETSGILCSIAWCQNNQTLIEYNVNRKNAHATLLAELVHKGFQELKLNPQSLSLISVGSGPGSFTGLRIGMAYAKGICFGLDIPLVTVTNFELLADKVDDNYPIYTLIDARRENYYTGKFQTSKTNLDEKFLLNLKQLKKYIPENGTVVVHEETSKGFFANSFNRRATIIQEEYNAARICALGYSKYIRGEYTTLDELEPLYLQTFAGVL